MTLRNRLSRIILFSVFALLISIGFSIYVTDGFAALLQTIVVVSIGVAIAGVSAVLAKLVANWIR